MSSMLEWRLIRTSALPAYVSLPSRTIPAVCPRIPQTIDHKDAISDYPRKTLQAQCFGGVSSLEATRRQQIGFRMEV